MPDEGLHDSSVLPATDASSIAASDFALDSVQQTGVGDAWRAYVARLRSGELGAVPSLLAIGVLVLVFSLSTDSFISLRNVQNFLEQAAPIAVIAMAVSFVLLLGEIDLAAGYTAGVCSAVMVLRLREGVPLPIAIAIAAVVAVLLGLFTGLLVAKLGIPSFIVTLSNFLTFQGILLLLVKEGGTVRLENQAVQDLVGANMPVWLSWAMTIAAIVIITAVGIRRQRHSQGTISAYATWLKLSAVAVGLLVFVLVLSIDRTPPRGTKQIVGMPIAVPAVVLILVGLTFLLNRTRFGRHLYAVGGNAEAARRAGVRVERIRLSAFTICAVLSAVAGAFIASSVDSVSAKSGGNDTLLLAVGAAVIGGTSLFGGKGRMLNAVLGALVLALIPNGLPLVGKKVLFGKEVDFSQSGIQFILAGLFLLAAASVDAISRKRAA
jgi:D-xylose transport system permease protein